MSITAFYPEAAVRSKKYEKSWIDSTGRVVLITAMTDVHLLNTMNYLRERYAGLPPEAREKLALMYEEYGRRYELTRQAVDKKVTERREYLSNMPRLSEEETVGFELQAFDDAEDMVRRERSGVAVIEVDLAAAERKVLARAEETPGVRLTPAQQRIRAGILTQISREEWSAGAPVKYGYDRELEIEAELRRRGALTKTEVKVTETKVRVTVAPLPRKRKLNL
ncbi:MAG TPA: hypothetical protein VLD66_06370 [Methyloceanibacter sp.]|nr:hypothetical protein [Methyloceanibacter sp.]